MFNNFKILFIVYKGCNYIQFLNLKKYFYTNIEIIIIPFMKLYIYVLTQSCYYFWKTSRLRTMNVIQFSMLNIDITFFYNFCCAKEYRRLPLNFYDNFYSFNFYNNPNCSSLNYSYQNIILFKMKKI